jgi:hypothetical protein
MMCGSLSEWSTDIVQLLAEVSAPTVRDFRLTKNATLTTVNKLTTSGEVVSQQDVWPVSSSSLLRSTSVFHEYDNVEYQAAASDLISSSAELLGNNSYERFKRFSEYPNGWGGGQGKKISSQSIAALQSFLGDGKKLSMTESSIFLTLDGNLQLAWEDVDGNAIELDFLPNEIVFFYEKNEEDLKFPLGSKGISSLKEKIKFLQLI